MNDLFHKHLKKAGEQISLTHQEREDMRRMVHAYMEMKPVRTPGTSGLSEKYVGRAFLWRPVAAVLVLALFVSSAGVSYAAENALPGDLLYPIKTQVNEPIQGALALSPSAKTAWAMSVAGERIQEAATLAVQGRLGTTTQQELQTNFQEHAKIATQNIEQEAGSSPEASDEAAIRFQAQLSEYQNVLAQIGAAKNIDTASLTVAIKNENDRVAAVRVFAESHATSTNDDRYAATGMQVAAQEQFSVSAALARNASGSLSTSSSQLVSAGLDSASTTISAGEGFAAKNATPDALGAFQNALTATEELGVFLQTSSAIHARTGLVVGQPQGEQASEKTPSKNKNSQHNHGNEETYASTTPSGIFGSSNASATTTNTNENGGSSVSPQVQTHVEVEQEGSPNVPTTPQMPPLPVSVPMQISL